MKYAAIAAILLVSPAASETPCEAFWAYQSEVHSQSIERGKLRSSLMDEMIKGIELLPNPEQQQWFSRAFKALSVMTIEETKDTRNRLKLSQKVEIACQ